MVERRLRQVEAIPERSSATQSHPTLDSLAGCGQVHNTQLYLLTPQETPSWERLGYIRTCHVQPPLMSLFRELKAKIGRTTRVHDSTSASQPNAERMVTGADHLPLAAHSTPLDQTANLDDESR